MLTTSNAALRAHHRMDVDMGDVELRNKIAALAARIDSHKAARARQRHMNGVPARLRGGQLPLASQGYPPSWQSHRGAPYGARDGRAQRVPTAYNPTPILLDYDDTPEDSSEDTTPPQQTEDEAVQWIRRDDRNLQLINAAVYKRDMQAQNSFVQQPIRHKHTKQQHEMSKVHRHLRTAGREVPGQPNAQILYVNGIRFLVTEGGSKLVKIDEDNNRLHATPKWANVGGVTYHRSKGGNLYRAGVVNAQREQAGQAKSSKPCLQFSTTGICAKGPACRFIHDPEKVAMCKEYLQKGECRAGRHCDLSHDPSPERVPACLHFQRGSCTNPSCRYAHIRVNPGAPVCKAFATYGYCPEGSICAKRHVHECPDYTNKGFCRNDKCHLPHVDRAGKLRKAAAARDDDDDGEVDGKSDVSSDPAYDSDDVDSDAMDEELLTGDASAAHQLSQQDDFVRF